MGEHEWASEAREYKELYHKVLEERKRLKEEIAHLKQNRSAKMTNDEIRKDFAYRASEISDVLASAAKSATLGNEDFDKWLRNNNAGDLWKRIQELAIINRDRRKRRNENEQ